MKLEKITFTSTVAYPGLAVLAALSLVCAIFPDWTSGMLTTIQAAIYKNLSWSYILLVSFFFIFLMVLAFSKDRKSTRLNSSHANISYAVFCLKKKNTSSLVHHISIYRRISV